MANYQGYGRSNYVHFTDPERVQEICGFYGVEWSPGMDGDPSAVTLLGENEWGGPNSGEVYFDNDEERKQFIRVFDGHLNKLPEEGEDEAELPDMLDVLCQYLPDDEVLVWQHIGYEKMRYLTGYAVAINNKGDTSAVNLGDIYELAKALGTTITRAEY